MAKGRNAACGHAYSGWTVFNDDQRAHGATSVTLTEFVMSHEFAEMVFENWEANSYKWVSM
jgi:Domain of unknown function (DUF6766)